MACGAGPKRRKVSICVAGYGKLGGRELGYGSDLDLVFLHDFTQADLLRLIDGHEDAHVAVHDLQDVELMDFARDFLGVDTYDLRHPLRRIHRLVTYLKFEHRFLRLEPGMVPGQSATEHEPCRVPYW